MTPQAPARTVETALQSLPGGVRVSASRWTYDVQIDGNNVVRIHAMPHGRSTPRTLLMDPTYQPGHPSSLSTGALSVKVTAEPFDIEIDDAKGTKVCDVPAAAIAPNAIRFACVDAGAFFGIENTSLPSSNVDRRQDIREGMYRVGGSLKAGFEGDGAAPLAYTKRYGILIDSDGGNANIDGPNVSFNGLSRPDVEAFVIVGPPKATIRAVADISGHAPMMPKWSLGFINTQWGSNETELRQIVDGYRSRNIPLDAFILDFDWKAWGEDDYGEWRWNSTSAPGNVAPNKFPNGASGKLASDLLAQGVKLGGIFKPRILLTNTAGGPDAAASYALAHNFFFPWQAPYSEYYSNRNARDIDFSNPLARSWYWQHTQPAYRTGIVAFWNDEADAAGDVDHLFPNFQFANMERALYEGARSAGDQRVFSLNRNFYLGAQRYAYAEWSGDIETSFDSMREQAIRMLGTLDLGEPHWSMDTGGFDGKPTPENYARWMQFAAFVPIMRVHGTLGQKRQPGVYGPQAEKVATDAINLRYELLPYFYSLEREAYETGIGIVRPLVWEFPDDGDAVYQTDEWMDGDALLVAPVFGEGQSHREVYLPAGTWTDYFRGTTYAGPTTIDYAVDPHTWADIPLFVRAGSIVATRTIEQWIDQTPAADVKLEIFPSPNRVATFTYYDDDGATYAYERGVYFKQVITATQDTAGVHVHVGPVDGTYAAPIRTYTIVVHGSGETLVVPAGKAGDYAGR